MLLVLLAKGIIVGLVIAVPVGPVGVLCLRRAVFDGRLFGLLSGLGAASADAIFGIIAGFGLTVVAQWLMEYQDWLRAAGGLFLLYAGIGTLTRRLVVAEEPKRRAESLLGAYLTAFALTMSNPVTILAFLGIFATVGFSGDEASPAGAVILVTGVTIGSLLWWIGLSTGAGLFRARFGEIHLLWLNRISGVLLVLSGLALLASLLVDVGL